MREVTRVTILLPPTVPQNRGFSLIELLSVIALIAILTTLAIPSLGGLRSAGAMNSAALNISLLLEQARTFAMANNTYVWVGFYEDSINGTLSVAAVSGTSGSVSDIGSANTLRPLIKPQLYENIRLQSVSGLTGMEIAESIENSNMTGFEGRSGSALITFKNVLQFGPMGGCRIKPDYSSRWIQLGIQPIAGNYRNENNIAAVQIAGLTGQIRVFRP